MDEDCQQGLNDDDTCVVIREPVKMTAYDDRRLDLRALQDKHAALMALPELTPHDRQRLAALDRQIPVAQERFEREAKRGLDDLWRKWRGIQQWRADSAKNGDDEYNATRRKVRAEPNADLSDLTPEQKIQRRRDINSDDGWVERKKAKGWTEDQITTALIVRQDERAATRKCQEQTTLDQATMEQSPHFGKF